VASRLATPDGALGLACGVREHCSTDARQRVLEVVKNLPDGDVRDLFADLLPRTGDPKLGPTPRPQAILALTGDPARGRELFRTERTQCIQCHKHEGHGREVGPDLTGIGSQRSREHLLESLLDPSRQVEPQYQLYLLQTADGRTLTGLLLRKDATEVVLRDAEGKEVMVPAADVESLKPARESLMPTGLLAELTAQQAADLLAFLESSKVKQ
jgi:putative heme-binding domain-containing protein